MNDRTEHTVTTADTSAPRLADATNEQLHDELGRRLLDEHQVAYRREDLGAGVCFASGRTPERLMVVVNSRAHAHPADERCPATLFECILAG